MNELSLIPSDGIVITEQELATLEEAKTNIAKSFRDDISWNTETLLETSILNDIMHPTFDSKYWQCQKEMITFTDALIMCEFDIEEREEKIEKFKVKYGRDNVRVRREKYLLQGKVKEKRDRIGQIALFDNKMKELKPKCKFSLTDPNEHQPFSLMFRFVREYASVMDREHGSNVGELRNLRGQLITSFDRIWKDDKKRELLFKTMPNDVLGVLLKAGLPETVLVVLKERGLINIEQRA